MRRGDNEIYSSQNNTDDKQISKDSVKELLRTHKLKANLRYKSEQDFGVSSCERFNKLFIKLTDTILSVISNQNFLRILPKTKKSLRSTVFVFYGSEMSPIYFKNNHS